MQVVRAVYRMVSSQKADGVLPLAVWPCARPGADADEVSRALLGRVVAEYSAPGELVAGVMCEPGSVLAEAVRAGRRAAEAGSEPLRVCLAAVADSASGRRGAASGACGAPGRTRRLLAGLAGRVDLVVLWLPAPGVQEMLPPPVGPREGCLEALSETEYADALAGVLAGCARLARPGGRVVAVCPRQTGAAAGLAVKAVRCGLRAGLSYLQHVIALRAPICGEALGPGLPAPGALGEASAEAAASIPHPVHDDVVVFTAAQADSNRGVAA